METNPYAAPTAAPTAGPPSLTQPVVSPYGPYRELRGLSRAVLVLLGLNILGASSFIYAMVALSEANLLFESDAGAEALVDQWIGRSEAISVAELVIFLTTAVFWCVWKNKSCKNAWLFRSASHQASQTKQLPSSDTFTPGWAAGWYFIPIAHLWKPFQAMSFIRNEVAGFFKGGAILGIWWTSWVVMNLASRVLTRERPLETTAEANSYNQGLIIDSGLTIVSAILAGIVIITMTSAQEQAAGAHALRPRQK